MSEVLKLRYAFKTVLNDKIFLISLFLIYGNILINSFYSFSIETSYAINFIFFFLAIFYNNLSLKLDKWIVISGVFLLLPLSMGIYNEWATRDILSDLVRYLAPFIGFTSSLVLFKKKKFDDIISFIFLLGFINIIFFYHSFFYKLFLILGGAPIIDYARNGFEVNNFFFLLFFFFLKYHKNNKQSLNKILITGYIIGFFLNPILLLSKAKLIALIILIFIIFIFYSNTVQKFNIMILFIISSILLLFIFDITVILERVINAYSAISLNDYSLDPSTFVRLAEIKNVFMTINENLIKNVPFGLGLGALYYDDYFPILGGVHAGNFRDDGGVHHIFTVYVAYLFRYGVVGLIILLAWIYYVFKKFHRCNTYDAYTVIIVSTFKIFILISLLADTFIPVYIYGNFQFGFLLGIGLTLVNLSNKYFNELSEKNEL